jgi:hypothetical protein
MRILAISDWQIQPAKWVTDLIKQQRADAILYAGDDVHRMVAPTGVPAASGPIEAHHPR